MEVYNPQVVVEICLVFYHLVVYLNHPLFLLVPHIFLYLVVIHFVQL